MRHLIPVEVIVRPDPLPRTQTGKVDRGTCPNVLKSRGRERSNGSDRDPKLL